MGVAETLADIFLDDPGFKFIDCYERIPVFKKLSKSGEGGRFWYAFSIEAERVIILGPDATRLDLNYAIAFIITHSLKNHFIACKNEETAAVVDFQYIKIIDGDLKIVMPNKE
jgi:hypothetical protein